MAVYLFRYYTSAKDKFTKRILSKVEADEKGRWGERHSQVRRIQCSHSACTSMSIKKYNENNKIMTHWLYGIYA